MEKVAISETAITKQEHREDQEVKKVEFNVDAEEFVPLLSLETNLPEGWKSDEAVKDKFVLKKKIGEDYKPVFMDGMTEKFVEGPHLGNGKDPEIPFVRYFSKSQALDFFNKKYFSPDPSGEILYRPYDGSEGCQDDYQQQQRPSLENLFIQSNIFRPPIIDWLVQDILYRQQLASTQPKGVSPQATAPSRRGGKQPPTSYPGRTVTRKEPLITTNGSQVVWADKEPLPTTNGSQEVWYDKEPLIPTKNGSQEVWDDKEPLIPMKNGSQEVWNDKEPLIPTKNGSQEVWDDKDLLLPTTNGSVEVWVDENKDVQSPNATSTPYHSPNKEKLENETSNLTDTIKKGTQLETANKKQCDGPLELRNPKSRGKVNLIVIENTNTINGQREPEERNAAKEGFILEAKDAGSVSGSCVSLKESKNLRSMEALSLEVNISIDAPNKEYSIEEEAESINL